MQSATFWQGIEQFNQQEFYECHDTLESLWMEAAEPDKTFYQGILQIAVGCYHLGNHNWRGAVILLGEGIRKLSEYQPIYGEINVSDLIEVSSNLVQKLQQINPEEIAYFTQDVIFPTILKSDCF
jgi:predicted metal-dependent hydrolase